MKTYSEITEGYSFDWNKFLNKEYEEYTTEELETAEMYSNKWTTCAVGSQCSILPRHEEDKFDEHGKYQMKGSPIDKELMMLGMEFNNRINSMLDNRWNLLKESFLEDQEEAKSILLQIELRSSYLINEIKKQSK